MIITEELKKRVKVIRANNAYEVRIAIGGGWLYKEIKIEKKDTEETLKVKAENILTELYNDFHYAFDTSIGEQDILDENEKPTRETQEVFIVNNKYKDNLPKEIKL